jgi:glycosyltransferase involved in cell wall biosynthesis
MKGPTESSREPTGVLHMVESLRLGGGERGTVEICARLDRSLFAPRLLTYREGADLGDIVQRHSIPWIRLSRTGSYDLSHVSAALREIRRHRIKILHTHLYGANAWGELVRRLAPSLRHISHVRQTGMPGGLLGPLVDRHWVSRSHLILTVSEVVRTELITRHGYAPERVLTLRTGVDTARIRPASADERRAARMELDLSEEDEAVGIVAGLRPEKDHVNFLDAAARVAATRPATRFLLAGDGPDSRVEELRSRVRQQGMDGRVRFLGARRDVGVVLRALDVAVLCSKEEALPRAVLEYMASGLPIVGTRVGGIPEALGDPPCGVLVAAGNGSDLATAIVGLLADPVRRRTLGQAARRRCETVFDLSRMMDALQGIYRRLADEAEPLP